MKKVLNYGKYSNNDVSISRLIPTLWVTSIYMVISTFNLISLFLPQANDFLWLAYKVYVGIAMGHFVDLTLTLFGGESAMINHVGEETPLSFRLILE